MCIRDSNYVIKLEERDNITESIEGSNINFKYEGSNEAQEIKDRQNPALWLINIFSNNKYIINEVYSFDRELLLEELEKLGCFNNENIIEPLDACFKYENGEYKIIKEVYGNKVNKELLYAYVLNSIILGERSINFCLLYKSWRCEGITEGEIVDAINRSFGSITLDGVKRRCRPGMGRCQGGFCGPRVQEIIAKELKLKMEDILLEKDGSTILFGRTK